MKIILIPDTVIDQSVIIINFNQKSPFSLEQVPHIMGNTWLVPGGATDIIVSLILTTQSSEGNQPRAWQKESL